MAGDGVERVLRQTMLSVAGSLTDENIQQIEFVLRLMGHSTASQLTCNSRCACRETLRSGVEVMELMRQRGIWYADATTGQRELQKLRDIFEDINRVDLARQLDILGLTLTEHRMQRPKHISLSDENHSLSFPVLETTVRGDGVECDGPEDQPVQLSLGNKMTTLAVSSRTTNDSSSSSIPCPLQQRLMPLQSSHQLLVQHHLPASPASNQTPRCEWWCGFDSALEGFWTWIRSLD